MTKHTSWELVLNPTYKEMANHYATIIKPSRVRSPKDKASVEGSVGAISTWILAALRNTHCFRIEELKEELRKKLEEFNHRPFTQKEGSRYSAFEEDEKFTLAPFRICHTRYQNERLPKYVQITISLLKACFILFHMSILADKLFMAS